MFNFIDAEIKNAVISVVYDDDVPVLEAKPSVEVVVVQEGSAN